MTRNLEPYWKDRGGPMRATEAMGEPLTKLSVNLLPRAMAALNEAAELVGCSRTDTVNRALLLYAEMERLKADGWEFEIVRPRWHLGPLGVAKHAKLDWEGNGERRNEV